MSRTRLGFIGLLVLLASTLAPSAPAQVVVDSHGFEAPFFTTTFNGTGQLEGQTPATFNGTWLRTKGPGLGSATVQTAVVASGAQAVRVDRAANSDDRWGVPVSGYPASGNFITVNWDMRVQQTAGPTNTFGPFLGMEAYDEDAVAIGLLGSLGVDATTGDVLFQAANTGFLTETGVTVAFGAWNHYAVEFNFSTHVYRFFLNGTLLGSQGFVDQTNVAGGLDEFTDANISALAAAGDPASQALTGTAYFDNFDVTEGPIPEPASAVTLLALSTLALRRRRCQESVISSQ